MFALPRETTPEELILWDVLEEHLDEGGFQLAQWEDALRSRIYVLDEVASGPEEAWLAHLNGLLIGGPPVFERLMLPLLNEPDDAEPEQLVMASIVAVLRGELDTLQPGLLEAGLEARRSIVRGCGIAGDKELDTWLMERLSQASESAQRAGLLELGAARRVRIEGLNTSLISTDLDEVAAATKAARWSDPKRHGGILERLMRHENSTLRDAAISTALHAGHVEAWHRCRALAGGEEHCTEELLEWLGLLGDQGELPIITGALQSERLRKAAIRALGLLGCAAGVDTLLPLLDADEQGEARLASEAFALITDFDLEDEAFHREPPEPSEDEEAAAALPELAEDDLDAQLEPGVEEDLPLLQAEQVERWWDENKARFDAGRRHLRGDAVLTRATVALLRDGDMRSRQAIAWGMAVRTRDRYAVQTNALSAVQRRQVAALEGMAAGELECWAPESQDMAAPMASPVGLG